MASRKNLKKRIKNAYETMLYLCMVEASAAENQQQREKAAEVMADLAVLFQDLVCRISHTEPGSTKLFYQKLRNDFAEGMKAALDKLYDQPAGA